MRRMQTLKDNASNEPLLNERDIKRMEDELAQKYSRENKNKSIATIEDSKKKLLIGSSESSDDDDYKN